MSSVPRSAPRRPSGALGELVPALASASGPERRCARATPGRRRASETPERALSRAHPGRRRAGLVVAAALALLSTFAPPRAAAAVSGSFAAIDARDELAVKSAFLYNFAARHVKWPESAFRDKTSPFVIGVLGGDPIAAVIADTCRLRKSGEHPIEVRVVEASGAGDCHLLFVPAAREHQIPGVASAVKGRPVLIVADSEQGVRRGAHLGFFLESSRVRFAAHPPSAKQAGLEVSSELLKLARVVERRSEDQP